MVKIEKTLSIDRETCHRDGSLTNGYHGAKREALRCLYCYDPPCNASCPCHIDIAGFIQRIQHNDLAGSLNLLKSKNVLSTVCSYVCPVENLCISGCPRGRMDRPISIELLQRFVCESGDTRKVSPCPIPVKTSPKKKVAVIGGGPAGLSCAHRLRMLGHSPTIFEKRERLGGLLSYGIPSFRLPEVVLKRELEGLLEQMPEVEIRTKTEVGKDLSIDWLLKNYGAVFLAVGLERGKGLGISGTESKGVYEAIQVLRSIGGGRFDSDVIGRTVAVIGGGNVAIDLASMLKSCFAKRAIVLYRRSRRQMPAWKSEVEQAFEFGVEFLWETLPVRIISRDGRVKGIECIRTSSEEREGEVGIISGSEFVIPVDSVMQAIGQEADLRFLSGLSEVRAERGRIVVQEESGQTGNPMIFAGGDIIRGSGTVVQAVEHGRRGADAIDRWIRDKNG